MQLPLQITFRDITPSSAVSEHVRRRAAKLDTFFDRLTSCRVAIESPNRGVHKGKHYHVRIDMTVPPRHEIVVGRHPGGGTQGDLHVAIDQAFDEAERMLADQARMARGEIKRHDGTPHGRVVRIFRERGYGFLVTSDEREIYFHEHSVLDGQFRHLEVGHEVRFAEEDGDKGPQASTVEVTHRARRARTTETDDLDRPSYA